MIVNVINKLLAKLGYKLMSNLESAKLIRTSKERGVNEFLDIVERDYFSQNSDMRVSMMVDLSYTNNIQRLLTFFESYKKQQ